MVEAIKEAQEICVAILGSGGSGKTTLAKKVASGINSFKGDFQISYKSQHAHPNAYLFREFKGVVDFG